METQGIDIEGADVIEKSDTREVTTKYGKVLKVANCKISDETGTVALSVWNDDVDRVKVGDKITIRNAYSKDFKGMSQLNLSRASSIEVTGTNPET